jgi:hypothetical protein
VPLAVVPVEIEDITVAVRVLQKYIEHHPFYLSLLELSRSSFSFQYHNTPVLYTKYIHFL